jgi:hypothetical protein
MNDVSDFPARARTPVGVFVRSPVRRRLVADAAGRLGGVSASSIKDTANAAFKKRVRIGESGKALARMQADRLAEDEKIERLRSLRLARAADEMPVLVKRKSPRA